jgi:hypothetical protein
VAGAAGILRETDTINIPAEDVATDPVSANIHKQIDITGYLPDGLLTTSGDQNKVTVYIRVRKAAGEAGTADTSSDTGSGATAAAAKTAEAAEE